MPELSIWHTDSTRICNAISNVRAKCASRVLASLIASDSRSTEHIDGAYGDIKMLSKRW